MIFGKIRSATTNWSVWCNSVDIVEIMTQIQSNSFKQFSSFRNDGHRTKKSRFHCALEEIGMRSSKWNRHQTNHYSCTSHIHRLRFELLRSTVDHRTLIAVLLLVYVFIYRTAEHKDAPVEMRSMRKIADWRFVLWYCVCVCVCACVRVLCASITHLFDTHLAHASIVFNNWSPIALPDDYYVKCLENFIATLSRAIFVFVLNRRWISF